MIKIDQYRVLCFKIGRAPLKMRAKIRNAHTDIAIYVAIYVYGGDLHVFLISWLDQHLEAFPLHYEHKIWHKVR